MLIVRYLQLTYAVFEKLVLPVMVVAMIGFVPNFLILYVYVAFLFHCLTHQCYFTAKVAQPTNPIIHFSKCTLSCL